MNTSAYDKRMSQLDARKMESARQQFPDLNKPSPYRKGGMEGLNANLAPKQETPAEADMESPFGMAFNHYSGQDSRFSQMMTDFGGLVSNLREQVKNGYMPEALAKDRITQFVQDGNQYFMNNKASPMDNPQVAGAIEGMLAQKMQGQQPQMEPSGLPNQEAPQGAPVPPQAQQMPQGGM
ncbi:MAG: hypothetical protein ACRC6V_04545 [Bacteroidales bacterium]